MTDEDHQTVTIYFIVPTGIDVQGIIRCRRIINHRDQSYAHLPQWNIIQNPYTTRERVDLHSLDFTSCRDPSFPVWVVLLSALLHIEGGMREKLDPDDIADKFKRVAHGVV
ncbi:hypothetical protein TNCV_2167541 [Trichonephila clavipes]|nr:hypothetical protein TNCV_2167541 [Trichonephila clavipes]